MKKIMIVVTMVLSILLWTTNVFAASESDLRKILTDSITINNKKYVVKNNVKVLIDKYLHENSLTSEDINYIYDAVKTARDIVEDQSGDTYATLSKKAKDELKQLVDNISLHTNVDATAKEGKLIIYNDDDTVFAIITDPIKQTGESTNIIYIAYVVSIAIILVGAGLLVRKLYITRQC